MRQATPADHIAFLRQVYVPACEVSDVYDISLLLMLAQTSIESNWGLSSLSLNFNNFHGIKPGIAWKKAKLPVVVMKTREVIDGKDVYPKDAFCVFSSPAFSFIEFAELVTRRYVGVIGADLETAARVLQSKGYATAPNYATTIIARAAGPALQKALKAYKGGA